MNQNVAGVVEEAEGVVFKQFIVPSNADLFCGDVEVFQDLRVEERLKGCSGEVSLCDEGREITKGGDGEECSGREDEEGGEE